MPRPGPRPYECVRRAWHSDRHRPMRGSIIQQIFRVVHETHSKPTKKNREWQEKLPIVVFKAEEIMYSKANSEAEYMDPDTLWDRVNDAVNTIIRRDESTETGELLPPCVEAALNLGCTPMRASRSQRHSNPRCYLNPRLQETVSASPRVLEKTNDEIYPQLSILHSGNQLNFERAATTMNSTIPVSNVNCDLHENNNAAAPHTQLFPFENIPPGSKHVMTTENDMRLKVGSVYPLYYGNKYQIEEAQFVSQVSETTDTNTVVGRLVGTSVAEPAEMGVFHNFLPCSSTEVTSKRITQSDFKNMYENSPEIICDLSLRLGMFSDSSVDMGNSAAQEAEDVGTSSSRDRGKFHDPSSK